MDKTKYIQEQIEHGDTLVGDASHANVQYSELAAQTVGLGLMPFMADCFSYPFNKVGVLGCHEGHEVRVFASLYPKMHITAVDLVPKFVEAAERYADEAVVADLAALPFEDDHFDWVYSSHTLEHCLNVTAAVKEMARVTKYGIAVAVPLQTESQKETFKGHHVFHSTANAWLAYFIELPDWEIFQVIVEAKLKNLRIVLKRTEEATNG